jgi:O-antigen ligase
MAASDLARRNAHIVDRARLERVADGLAAATAASLPWSTSATGILAVLWLVTLVPTLDLAMIRRELATTAGVLPILLVALGAIGMLWADVSWRERLAGFDGFYKLAFIPLLLAQYRRSARGGWVIFAFFAASSALLVLSWILALAPDLSWRGKQGMPGVPVKDYISQSSVFVLCGFALLSRAVEQWRSRHLPSAFMLVIIAAAFLANVAYVEAARTTLVIAVLLVLLFGFREFGWPGLAAGIVVGAVLAGLLWMSSPYLRGRVTNAVGEVQAYLTAHQPTSSGLRLDYWKRSVELVTDAPVIGYGTGSIPKLLQPAASEAASFGTVNPHSQIFVVALQLGLVGSLLLVAMWIAHLALFKGGGFVDWIGLVAVVENVVGSLFNSHLSDFTQGWTYVFAVGVLGGMTLRKRHGGAGITAPAAMQR